MIYGLPLDKKFPLNNPEEIIKAIHDFNNCHKIKRRMLADNINQQLCKHDMMVKVPETSDFINYIDDAYKAGVLSQNRFTQTCKGICDIEYDGRLNDYNRQVFERMIELSKDIKDKNDCSTFLNDANEYADKVMKFNNVLPKEFTLSMEIVQNICKSLVTTILGFSPSEAYVDKLLEDLEEFHILYSTSVWYMKRHLLYINHMATNIGLKNDVNKKIADKTNQLLRNETSLFNQMKLSKGRLNHMRDTDNNYFVSYLKDKQMELKAYLSNQYSYFLTGDGTTSFYGSQMDIYETDEMKILGCINDDLFGVSNHMTIFLNRFKSLSTDISNSQFFMLKTKYKRVKQFNINNISLTILMLNKEPHIVCRKKTNDINTMYIIPYSEIESMSYQPQPVSGDGMIKQPIKAIKVRFNKKLYNDSMEKALESATRF